MIAVSLVGCATWAPSKESLKSAGSCKVWKDTAFGSRTAIDVAEERATYKHSCKIFGMWWCSETSAYFKHGPEIYTANSGLLTLETKVATFEKDKMTIDAPLVKAEPFEFKNGEAAYTVQALGQRQNMKVEYNESCSARQAAVGTALLISK